MSDSTETSDISNTPDPILVKKLMDQHEKTKVRHAKFYQDNKAMLLERRKENRIKERQRKEEQYKNGEKERPKRGRPPTPPEVKAQKKKPGTKPRRIVAKARQEDDRIVVVVQNPTDKPIEYRYINTPDVKIIQ